MAFSIVISEDPDYSTGILENRSLKIKASIKVIGNTFPKVLKEVQKVFTSIDELNSNLKSIEAYGNADIRIYLELTASTSTQTVEFVQVGEITPLIQSALDNSFTTYTYHGDAIFPYSEVPKQEDQIEELSGTIKLLLISKEKFEDAIVNEYSGETPSISIDEAISVIDELTAEYNRIGAKISAYKKQANRYITFDEFDKSTEAFYKKYYELLSNDFIPRLTELMDKAVDNSVVSIQVDSKISDRYKAIAAARTALTNLLSVLNAQGFK
jgi:hypothetical protein